MKQMKKLAAVSAVALLAGTVGASAAVLDFTNMTAAWGNNVGGNVTSNNSPQSFPNNASISWGDGGGVSGYDFGFLSDPVPNPAAVVDDPFDLGKFTHRNQPITAGTAITSVDLDLTGDIRVDGVTIVTGASFDFSFAHNETPNNATPCELGDTIPCGDGVTISLLNTSDSFTVDGVEYTMTINGFIPEGGGAPSTFFFSDEGADNSAILEAVFTAQTNVVPLPAAGWLLLGGLGGLAALRRRQKKAA